MPCPVEMGGWERRGKVLCPRRSDPFETVDDVSEASQLLHCRGGTRGERDLPEGDGEGDRSKLIRRGTDWNQAVLKECPGDDAVERRELERATLSVPDRSRTPRRWAKADSGIVVLRTGVAWWGLRDA